MPRPLRIFYPGALYHVTSRGNRRAHIYVDERDYLMWQDRLAATRERYNFAVHAFCQMPNHYHLLVETVEGNLSDGMHYLNSTYAQKFNHRHSLSGHVVQGRFHAVPVRRDSQLLEVARYIAQNPVRAGLVPDAESWRWSSHRNVCGLTAPLPWLTTEWLLRMFGTADLGQARSRYRGFVRRELVTVDPLLQHTEQGSDEAVSRKRTAQPLAHYQTIYAVRDEAMARAYFTTAYRMQDIAGYFRVSTKTVSRAVARYDAVIKAEAVSMSGCDPMVDTGSAVGVASSVGINAPNPV
ncbi:REP-associated tyrosine transposase [Pseudoduganella chitinolytica]|uniref:Transposase n=1 Tax=Pseudoduganella chitinolytica TaxID=34070 RepID=A0ABY8B8B5_9BURK|nr:transposase [Pseudoduganella chitinolytica]WEF30997.1 transposase [Pseudoduganella chitinolytica]